jgi:hypothetical protein
VSWAACVLVACPLLTPSHPPSPALSYSKELLSRGRYAQLLSADNRPFSEDEAALFDRSAQFAYESFRDKAAACRKMPIDDMQVGL